MISFSIKRLVGKILRINIWVLFLLLIVGSIVFSVLLAFVLNSLFYDGSNNLLMLGAFIIPLIDAPIIIILLIIAIRELRDSQQQLGRRVKERTAELTSAVKNLEKEIAERNKAREESNELRFQKIMILNATAEGIYGLDLNGNTTFVNPAAAKMFGWELEELIGKSQHDIQRHTKTDGTFYPREECPLCAAFNDSAIHRVDNEVFWRKDDSCFPVAYTSSPTLDKCGQIAGAVVTFRDISKLKANEKLLQISKEAAETANNIKTEFLANMSHEIRTPMNGVIGMTNLLKETELTNEQREYIDMLKTSSDSMMLIINNILDIAEIEADKLVFEHIEFDLRNLITDTLKPMPVCTQTKGIELSCNVSAEVTNIISGDPGRLQQILINLIGNAIKFTESGEIGISVEIDSQTEDEVTLHFLVRDTGIGISEDQKEHIFGTFNQADSSLTRQYGGTGLGLSICTQLVKIMQGNIWIESEVGKGSTFHFTARFGIAHESVKQEPSQEIVNSEYKILDNQKKYKDCQNVHILIAENNKTNQILAQRTLEKKGYKVEIANDGEEVLEALKNQYFDIVLMDVQMPKMDGLEATRIIRNSTNDHFDPEIPIIAVTAHAFEKDKELCLTAGMNSYITKPFKREVLFKEIEKLAQAQSMDS